MCLNRRQLDPKSRRRMMVANLAFILGILLLNSARWHWVHPASQLALNWLDAFTGFCFGLYIAIMLFVQRCARNNSGVGSGEL